MMMILLLHYVLCVCRRRREGAEGRWALYLIPTTTCLPGTVSTSSVTRAPYSHQHSDLRLPTFLLQEVGSGLASADRAGAHTVLPFLFTL